MSYSAQGRKEVGEAVLTALLVGVANAAVNLLAEWIAHKAGLRHDCDCDCEHCANCLKRKAKTNKPSPTG